MYALLSLLLAVTATPRLRLPPARLLPAFDLLVLMLTRTTGRRGGRGGRLAGASAPPDRPGLLRDGLLSFGATGLLYAPWLPTLAFQAAHTGAPWSNKPRFGVPIQIAKGLLAAPGRPSPRRRWAGAWGCGCWGRSRGSPECRAVAMVAMASVTRPRLASPSSPRPGTCATSAPPAGPAHAPRRAGALPGGRAGDRGAACCAAVCRCGRCPTALQNKSNVRDAGAQIKGDLRPEQLLIAGQPEQLPLVHYYLPGPYRWATTMGPASYRGSWTGADSAISTRPRTATALEPLLGAGAGGGGHVLLVRPVTYGTKNGGRAWTTWARRCSAQWGQALSDDRRFRSTTIAPTFYKHASVVGDARLVHPRRRAAPGEGPLQSRPGLVEEAGSWPHRRGARMARRGSTARRRRAATYDTPTIRRSRRGGLSRSASRRRGRGRPRARRGRSGGGPAGLTAVAAGRSGAWLRSCWRPTTRWAASPRRSWTPRLPLRPRRPSVLHRARRSASW